VLSPCQTVDHLVVLLVRPRSCGLCGFHGALLCDGNVLDTNVTKIAIL
jgi:hypothetical protein